jgi:hypothetical protein
MLYEVILTSSAVCLCGAFLLTILQYRFDDDSSSDNDDGMLL